MFPVIAIGVLMLGYLFLWQPLMGSSIAARAQCWMKSGTYVRYGVDEPGYRRLMSADPVNKVRLEASVQGTGDDGAAQGCLPDGACIADPVEANRTLQNRVLLWRAQEAKDGVTGYLLGKLTTPATGTSAASEKVNEHKQRLAQMLGLSQTDTKVAEARRAEATYCSDFLEKQRLKLPVNRVGAGVEREPD